ncbi:MAG TPA: hypothetical protein VGH29_15970, partial [Candidatus Binataceae bacterium]
DLTRACGAPPRDEPLLEMLSPKVINDLAPAPHSIKAPVSDAQATQGGREIHLSLGALRRYLECPLQGAAQYALGMVDEDDGSDEDPGNEPLDQTQLDRVVLLRDAFWAGRGELEAARRQFDQAMRLHQLQGRAPVGPFAEAITTAFARRLDLCVGQARALKIASLAGWERIRIGGAAEEIAAADRVLEPIVLDVPMRPGDGDNTMLRIALRATISVSAGRDASINCIARDSGAMPYHFLGGFLSAMVLAAGGETRARYFNAIVVGSSKDSVEPAKLCRTLKIPTPEQATTYLAGLAADLFSGRNHYFLPFEAVAEIVRRKKGARWPARREITDIIESIRQNDFARCRSDYGPVRNSRDYPPPPSDEVVEIIKRRFQPIMTIFAKVPGER